jgi:hypothetical protein
MNKENLTKLRNKILEIAPRMQPLLPPLPSHPHGRIAIAHMYSVLEGVFECPVKEARDCRLQDALDIVQYCMDNATQIRMMTPLREKYQPEPKSPPQATLDQFFE